jgi:hypothetical protein
MPAVNMTEGSGPLGWLTTALVAAAVLSFAGRSVRAKSRIKATTVVLLGGGLTWLFYLSSGLLLYPDNSVLETLDITRRFPDTAFNWFRYGLVWLLIYQALKAFPPNTIKRKLFSVLSVMFFSGFVAYLLFELQTFIYNPQGLAVPWPPSFDATFRAMNEFSSAAQEAAYAVMVVWLSNIWLHRDRKSQASGMNKLEAVALGGMVMSKYTDQSTRYLCASALLGQSSARESLIHWFKDGNRAVAPEIGVDLKLAVQTARYAEKRERRYWWIYFAIAVVSLTATALTSPWVAIIGALIAAGVWARKKIQEQNEFVPLFWPERFNSEEVANRFPGELEAEDLSALPHPDQNFFVYGGFLPFVGSGHDLGGWSVAIALDKSKQDLGYRKPIQSVEIPALYEAIDLGLEHLNLPSIEKRDCFFANGVDVRGNKALLPNIFGRPVQSLEPEVAQRYMLRDDEKVRHYRCYRIVDWGGELALSYYLRCSRRGNTLFVETKRFILTPIAAGYRGVDRMVPMELSEQIRIVLASLLVGPLRTLVSPFVAFAEVSRWWAGIWDSEDKARNEMIEKNPLFNYGTVQSFRQIVSSGEYGHYFQKIDGDFYNKLFERAVLDTLIEFLDAHGIDTSELKDRQTTIMNSGVIVQGGDVKAESLAVGTGAQAIKTAARKVLGGKAAAKGAGE